MILSPLDAARARLAAAEARLAAEEKGTRRWLYRARLVCACELALGQLEREAEAVWRETQDQRRMPR